MIRKQQKWCCLQVMLICGFYKYTQRSIGGIANASLLERKVVWNQNGIGDDIRQWFENSACKPESQDSESPNQQYTF